MSSSNLPLEVSAVADAIVGGFERLEAQLERIGTFLERLAGPPPDLVLPAIATTLPAMREARPDFGLDELLVLARRWARELLASGHPPELRTFMHAVVASTDTARARAEDLTDEPTWDAGLGIVIADAIEVLADAIVTVGRAVQKELGA